MAACQRTVPTPVRTQHDQFQRYGTFSPLAITAYALAAAVSDSRSHGCYVNVTIVRTGLPLDLRLAPEVATAYDRAMSSGSLAVDLPAEGWFCFADDEPQSFASCGLIVDFSAAGFSTWLRAVRR